MFTFCLDKARLARHFDKDPVLFAYHTGDLDDFFFPHCQYAAIYGPTAHVEEVALIFSAGEVAAVQMFGVSRKYPAFLREIIDVLPTKFNGHYLKSYLPVLTERYDQDYLGRHFKMTLQSFIDDASSPEVDGEIRIRRMEASDDPMLVAFYEEAYPDGYFISKMRETGKYFGLFMKNELAAVSGVHVYSPEYKIAVLGSIATHPDFRGRGYSQVVTRHLVRELAGEGLRICLNVRGDNAPAIKAYANIGFVKTHEYEEGYFALR